VPFVVAGMLVLTAVLAAIALARVSGSPTLVPGVVGYTLDDARALASGAELEIEVAAERNAPDPAGTIIDQEPDAGEFTSGHAVRIWVSKGPAPVEVPNIVGASRAEAESALAEAGFPVEPVLEFNDNVAADLVVSTDPPAGGQVAPETVVTVVISKGHAPVVVPEVAGLTYEEAQAALGGVGFQPQRVDEFSDDVALGDVIRTEPEIGSEQPFESQVTVVVSKGPDLVEVPDVRGETLDDAAAALEAQGFVVEVEGRFQAGRPVQFQDPAGGEMVKRGSTVTVRQQPGGGNDD
jgi:serine/threonine-protein kinase